MNHGDCFFNKALPGVPSHPWVIISDSAQNPTDVVIVNLTDADKYFDQTCILDVADFPGWITKQKPRLHFKRRMSLQSQRLDKPRRLA